MPLYEDWISPLPPAPVVFAIATNERPEALIRTEYAPFAKLLLLRGSITAEVLPVAPELEMETGDPPLSL